MWRSSRRNSVFQFVIITTTVLGASLLARYSFAQKAPKAPISTLTDDGKEFLSGFRKAYQSVQKRVQDRTMSVHVSGFRGRKSVPVRVDYTYKYYSRGDNLVRLDKVGPTKLSKENKGDLIRTAFINEYGFQLATNSGANESHVLSDRKSDSANARVKIHMEGVPSCAFSLYGVPLENFIYDTPGYDSYQLTKFDHTEVNNRKAIVLGGEFKFDSKPCNWEVLIDNEHSVVLSYTIGELLGTPEAQWRRGVVDYKFSEDGSFPEIKTLAVWDEVGSNREIYNKYLHEVTDFIDHAPARELFYPQSLGIPIEFGAPSRSWIAWSIALSGLFALVWWIAKRGSLRKLGSRQ